MLTGSGLYPYGTHVCPVGSGSNGDPQAVRTNHGPSSSHFPDEGDVSLSVTLLFFSPSLILPFPLLRVISQAVLKWPPAIFPNPSYMLFGAVSSKPHLLSPKQRGCHCAVTGSIDFLWEVEKFFFNGTSPEVVRSWGSFCSRSEVTENFVVRLNTCLVIDPPCAS